MLCVNKKITKVIVTAVILLFIAPFYKVFAQSKYYNVIRLAGQDRYSTSSYIASQVNPGIANNVILASGKDFPDALAGATLSKKLNAPILLVDDIDSPNSYEWMGYMSKHLSENSNIYLLGGEGSISNDTLYGLQRYYKNIKRLGGANRFDTNRSIVNEMNVEIGTPVVIVNGFNFPDALSISSIAASKGYPIFMSENNSIPDTIMNKISSINPSKVYIIGGTGVLNGNIQTQLKNKLSSINDENIVRISGNNRYETSLKVADYFKSDSKNVVLANGENFPDALSGAALAAKLNAPTILTDGKNISSQKDYIDSLDSNNVTVLGGQGSISSDVESCFNGNKLDTGGSFNGQEIIDLKTADINNNGSLENLILTGGINNNRNVTLYVQNAFNGQLISSKLVGNSYFGYGQIILADVTGDGSPEIISIAEIGGNTGNETCDIETANENGLVKIDPGFSNPNYSDYDVSPDIFSFTLNCNTLNMYSNKFGKSCSVDLTNDTALQTAIAEDLEINPYVSDGPVYSLYNIGNDIYGLKMSRGVSGSCHADSIGGFDVYYRYADGIMQLNDIGFNSPYPIQ